MSFSVIYFINFIMVAILTSFFVGTKGLHIKRIVTEIPTSILSDAIISIDYNENFYPHFDLTKVKHNVNSYLIKSLKDECNSYFINFSPYKIIMVNNKETYYIDTGDYIRNIQMHFYCNYFNNFSIDFYMKFLVLEKGEIKNEY